MIGEVINNYRIISLLGEGGMGAVYLAEHPFMGRKAAIKVLRREFAEDRGLVERFMNEARAANAIRHPNIIDIIDVGRMPSGIPYLMMELLEGVSLSRRIEQAGRLPLAVALDVAIQTTGALAAAHAKEIVHRDLKPDNLFLITDAERPSGERLKVLDFGIAKLRADLSGGSAKTQSGSLMGTPPYMSPEQCRGITDEIDHRTDIYALGIILYEMLCGAPPFVSAGWGDIVIAHLTQEPDPPRARNPEIPPPVEALILKALAKKREDRFGSMAEMQAALRGSPGLTGTLAFPAAAATPVRSRSITRPTTTFQGAVGEVTPAGAILAGAAQKRAAGRRARGRLVALGAVAAAAVVAVVVVAGGGGSRRPPVAEVSEVSGVGAARPARAVGAPAAPARGARPAAEEAAALGVPAPAEARAPAGREAPPSAPAGAGQILLRLGSEPAGAEVIDVEKGTVLGSTPLAQRLDRRAGALELRVAKEGFAASELSVPLGEDFQRTVRLERSRPRASRHESGSSPARHGAAGGSNGPAPSGASASTTATAPPAPAGRPKSVEKW